MFSNFLPAVADRYVSPADAHTVLGLLQGLSGPAVVAAIIGGLIGYAAACKIDALPAGIAIGLGMAGMLGLMILTA